MSELQKYMKALAKERGENWERYSELENRLISYHEQYDLLAEAAGVDVEHEDWWDISEGKRFEILIARLEELKAFKAASTSDNTPHGDN